VSINILQAMQDPKLWKTFQQKKGLLSRKLAPDSWRNWKSFLATLFALPMDEEQVSIYRQCTGRTDPPKAAFEEAFCIVGRRGGKSLIAALVAVFLAVFKTYDLSPGETGTLMVLSADKKQSRVVLGYIKAFFKTAMLRGMVLAETRESIRLNNSIVIEVHVSSFKTTRGYTCIGVVCDEIAFWQSESASNPAGEVLNALRPSLATTHGLLLCISSPYSKTGPLYENFRENFGKNESPILVWRAPSRLMNPMLSAEVVERALARDRAAASAEFLAEFRDDIGGFLSIEEIERCVVLGRSVLSPVSGLQYRAFCDPSGGRSDAMTLGIAHGEGERAILDLLAEREAPFSPQEATKEFCQILKRYKVSEVSGDRYSAQWVSEAFEKLGIRYLPSEKNRSELYLEFLPAMTSGQIELLDNERMKQQFANLQRRTGSGRDSVDHGVGGRDDLSNSAAGAICRVLESNASGMLGLLMLHEDIAAGRRKMPASPEEQKSIVAVTRATHREPAVLKPTCPTCKPGLVQPRAVLGGWQCNQCGASLDNDGKLTSAPTTKLVIGVNCCPDAFPQCNGQKCGACGLEVSKPQTEVDFQQRARSAARWRNGGNMLSVHSDDPVSRWFRSLPKF
jgi:ribosomal protein L37AE/L43A